MEFLLNLLWEHLCVTFNPLHPWPNWSTYIVIYIVWNCVLGVFIKFANGYFVCDDKSFLQCLSRSLLSKYLFAEHHTPSIKSPPHILIYKSFHVTMAVEPSAIFDWLKNFLCSSFYCARWGSLLYARNS